MNILVTLDSNYIYPLSVMLRSLAANCPGSRIDLYVVYASLTEDDFSRMESALGGSDHEVHRIKVDDAIFSGFPVLDRISKATGCSTLTPTLSSTGALRNSTILTSRAIFLRAPLTSSACWAR